MGLLHATPTRGKEVFAFTYNDEWLASSHAHVLDPSLRLLSGPQHAPQGRENFGVFLDSSPDRFGRVLLKRREALRARTEGRRARALTELDVLLGVFDGHRFGALRFRRPEGPFLDDDASLASPPWTSLRALEQASLRIEAEGVEDDPRYGKWLQLLLAPGRSLGGARPKASVVDDRGRLWIAKFPSVDDEEDIGAWEDVAHALAMKAGIVCAEATSQRFGSRHRTFMTRRFDRSDDGARLHAASAMTLLERQDGDDGASYLDIASAIVQGGARVAADLEQLWRRIVFFMCISNVDDHLRNHAFLLDAKGWLLAPAYDMNPVSFGDGLTLNVSHDENTQDIALAFEVAEFFRVKPKRSRAIVDEVAAAVRTWREEAKARGLSRAAQERMAGAFRLVDEEST